MHGLILFEAFEKPIYSKNKDGFKVGNFNTFIKKYNKSNYVSKKEIKKFNNSDIKFDYFKELEDKVEKYLDFISCNDINILEDILLDIRDDFSFEIESYFFKLKFREGTYWDSNTMNIYLKPEETSVEDKYDIMKNIINDINNSREKMVQTTKDNINSVDLLKTRYYNKTKLSTMSGKNPFSKILVYPNIDIGVNLLFNNNDYWWNEDLTSDEKHAIIHNNSKNLREFESAFKMCISRYLDAIGFKDIKFTLSVLSNTISIDFF